MIKRPGLAFIMIFVVSEALFCQETNYGPGYQTMIVNNPAFSGSSLDGTLRLSYLNFFPGNSYNFHSVFLSYDSYFQSLHGGAGFYLANDYIGGIVNDLRGGLSYSYFLQAGKDLFIYAGLSAAFFHRGFNFSDAVFPDQIDQMGIISNPSSELMSNENPAVFDAGTGFMFFYKRFAGGFAIAHLTQPDLYGNGSSDEKLKRKYLINLIADIDLNKESGLKIMPLASFEMQGNYICSGAGAVLQSNSLSFSSLFMFDNNKNIDVQAGFSLRWEKIGLYYNYRFNLNSVNSLVPFSLVHQTGLTFSLHNVEKRIKFSTINAPYM
jgi:type IX secretion system PorP/SprF family membrane protein